MNAGSYDGINLLGGSRTAIIDSGTSLIVMNVNDMETLAQAWVN